VRVVACVEAYVERKRVSGFIYRATGKILLRFAHFVRNADISDITDDDIELFVTRNAASNNTQQRYISQLTKFFVYWYARRQIKRIPSIQPRPTTKSNFFPYIYTRSEILALLAAIEPCHRFPRCCLDAETVKVILLMVYGTGMRISDVLGLLDSDIDWQNRTIRIRSLHPNLTRVIPIGPDVVAMLRRYVRTTRQVGSRPEKTLFLTKEGNPVPYAVIGHSFQQLRRFAGVCRRNSSYQPRIHDLRHSFAVHSIASWSPDVMPTEKMLSMLAAYMGDVTMTGVGRYVELSPSTYQDQLAQLGKKSKGVATSRVGLL
jgi:integrase/recombinase XerD